MLRTISLLLVAIIIIIIIIFLIKAYHTGDRYRFTRIMKRSKQGLIRGCLAGLITAGPIGAIIGSVQFCAIGGVLAI